MRGRSGRKTPGHPDPQTLPACSSLGTQGNQRSTSNTVYFQMTLFKKNSLTQMLGPESGMWRDKQLCPLPRACTALWGMGQELGAVLGDTVCTRSGHGARLWALSSVSCALAALTPLQTQQGRLVLASLPAPSPQAWSSRTFATAPVCSPHTPGQSCASRPTGLPACVHLGLQPAPTLSVL